MLCSARRKCVERVFSKFVKKSAECYISKMILTLVVGFIMLGVAVHKRVNVWEVEGILYLLWDSSLHLADGCHDLAYTLAASLTTFIR